MQRTSVSATIFSPNEPPGRPRQAGIPGLPGIQELPGIPGALPAYSWFMGAIAPRPCLTAVFFAAGLLATVMQVFLLRDLLVNASGDEASIGVGLAFWLLGIGAGAWFWRRLPEARSRRETGSLLALLLAAGPALLILGRGLRLALAPPAGELPGLGMALLLAAATLSPAGALIGALFTTLSGIASSHWTSARGITRLYVVESLGSLAGGLAATLALSAGAQPSLALIVASLLAASLSLPATFSNLLGRRLPSHAVSIGLLVLAALSPWLESATERMRFRGIAPGISFRASLQTPYQHLAAGGDFPLHLYSGGQYAASFPDPWSSETLAHESACMTGTPSRVLALPGVATGSLRFLLRHPVSELVIIEPDTRSLAFLSSFLPAEDRSALSDPRVRIVNEDPRRFLARERVPFDLILLFGQDPVTILGARLLSREFFALCAGRLSAGGALVLPVRTAPMGLTGHTQGLGGSLFSSLAAVFPVVRATPGPESLFVAGRDATAVTLDPGVLAARWSARNIDSSVFSGELFRANFPPDRVRETEGTLRAAATRFPAGTDDRPVSFRFALARRQAETVSSPGRLLVWLARLPAWVLAALFLAPSLLAVLARKTFQKSPAVHAVAAAGAAGMTSSLLLLFSYQTSNGALYGELGLLTSVFMLGLALGGVLGARARDLRLATLMACAATSGIASLFPLMQKASAALPWTGLAVHAAALLASGLATGAVFPAAATVLTKAGEDARQAGGWLEAADHAGAAIAALAVSILLVPALGMAGTAWMAASTAGLALAGWGSRQEHS